MISDNFEYYSGLAESDPDKFNEITRQMIEQAIDNAPSDRVRRRLAGSQWKLDISLDKCKSPDERKEVAFKEMWSSFIELNEVMK